FEQALKIDEEMGKKGGVASMLRSIAEIYTAMGDYKRAVESASRSASIAGDIDNPELLAYALSAAGIAYLSLGDDVKAYEALRNASNKIEGLRTSVAGSEQERQRFFQSKVAPYYAMIDLLIAQGKIAEAFGYAERSKARSLLDILQSGHVDISNAMSP